MHLIVQLSAGRRRAIAAARLESLAVLALYEPSLLAGGPFGEIGGLFWLELASPRPEWEDRLPLLAYAAIVYELISVPTPPMVERRSRSEPATLPTSVRWHGGWYAVRERWRRDEAEEREAAPDRRTFLLPGAEGQVRAVRGYRGGRRGLPPADARLTVNLTLTRSCRHLLDPFAGAGGIVAAALPHGLTVFSLDIDPFLMHGLAGLGASHCVADAGHLPFRDASLDAIATEPPYAPELAGAVCRSLPELARVTRAGGRLCLFCSRDQAPVLAGATPQALHLLHRLPIDRKGTACEALVWERV